MQQPCSQIPNGAYSGRLYGVLSSASSLPWGKEEGEPWFAEQMENPGRLENPGARGAGCIAKNQQFTQNNYGFLKQRYPSLAWFSGSNLCF